MLKFYVDGPRKVPCSSLRAAKSITPGDAASFWTTYPTLKAGLGCYLFAIRAAKGFKPIYAGKATKTFGQEVFTNHKLRIFNQALANQLRGTPVLFFVVYPSGARGAKNRKAIDEAETFLIQQALLANKNLLNDRKTHAKDAWGIRGVLRGGKGKASKAASELRRAIKY